jgi:hypothetical protein
MMKNETRPVRRTATLLLLLAAVTSPLNLLPASCTAIPVYVTDPVSGQLRPATSEEAAQIVTTAGQAGAAIATAAGRPDIATAIDLIARMLAVLIAWVIRPKNEPPVVTVAPLQIPRPEEPVQ